MAEQPIQIAEYDLAWPSRFQDESAVLAKHLRGVLVGRPEHIGSTAVPGLAAKPIIDIMAGMYTAIAVLAALAERSQSGQGDFVDISMLDVATAMLANQAMNYLVSGAAPIRRGNKHPNIQPQDVFPVRDGHIVLAVGNDEQFQRFAAAIGLPELGGDPRYSTNRERVNNLDTLHPLITETLRQRDLADWIAVFGQHKVPCGPINTVPMVFAEPQVQHRQMLRDLPHPLSGTVPSVVSPMRFERSALTFERPPPLLGEHTAEVLATLGLVAEDAQ